MFKNEYTSEMQQLKHISEKFRKVHIHIRCRAFGKLQI